LGNFYLNGRGAAGPGEERNRATENELPRPVFSGDDPVPRHKRGARRWEEGDELKGTRNIPGVTAGHNMRRKERVPPSAWFGAIGRPGQQRASRDRDARECKLQGTGSAKKGSQPGGVRRKENGPKTKGGGKANLNSVAGCAQLPEIHQETGTLLAAKETSGPAGGKSLRTIKD